MHFIAYWCAFFIHLAAAIVDPIDLKCEEVCQNTPACRDGFVSYCKWWQEEPVCFGLYRMKSGEACFRPRDETCPEKEPIRCSSTIEDTGRSPSLTDVTPTVTEFISWTTPEPTELTTLERTSSTALGATSEPQTTESNSPSANGQILPATVSMVEKRESFGASTPEDIQATPPLTDQRSSIVNMGPAVAAAEGGLPTPKGSYCGTVGLMLPLVLHFRGNTVDLASPEFSPIDAIPFMTRLSKHGTDIILDPFYPEAVKKLGYLQTRMIEILFNPIDNKIYGRVSGLPLALTLC
ncbi:hypothetical protein FOL47_006712 [Perkinsus chesapeaki]|uniref:Uncharacterized protein n=1 Tax=Perkinsus chesapeaki TaxID=330153 RepID=A0A7J6MXG0_PERCH|nr:hypothetical protein FOL47_006712 [Perkinsus chesapeaki]